MRVAWISLSAFSVSLMRLEISLEVILDFLKVSTISSLSSTHPKNKQEMNVNKSRSNVQWQRPHSVLAMEEFSLLAFVGFILEMHALLSEDES